MKIHRNSKSYLFRIDISSKGRKPLTYLVTSLIYLMTFLYCYGDIDDIEYPIMVMKSTENNASASES